MQRPPLKNTVHLNIFESICKVVGEFDPIAVQYGTTCPEGAMEVLQCHIVKELAHSMKEIAEFYEVHYPTVSRAINSQ